MEAGQDQEAMNSKDHTHIIKGKRTKRQRPRSPLSASPTTGGGACDNSGEAQEEEEEDMANCLILLAQGNKTQNPPNPPAATTTTATAGIYLHRCQTCHRSFTSFQALGGHRASHKKPKPFIEEKDQFDKGNIVISLQVPTRGLLSATTRVHECLICGAEFGSGQALGGHMRRHRAMARTTTDGSEEAKKQKDFLSLDLNLPAPEDDDQFASKGQVIVFSSSPLIDCHF